MTLLAGPCCPWAVVSLLCWPVATADVTTMQKQIPPMRSRVMTSLLRICTAHMTCHIRRSQAGQFSLAVSRVCATRLSLPSVSKSLRHLASKGESCRARQSSLTLANDPVSSDGLRCEPVLPTVDRAVEVLRRFELLEASVGGKRLYFSASADCSASESGVNPRASVMFCSSCSRVVMPTTCDATGWLSAYR